MPFRGVRMSSWRRSPGTLAFARRAMLLVFLPLLVAGGPAPLAFPDCRGCHSGGGSSGAPDLLRARYRYIPRNAGRPIPYQCLDSCKTSKGINIACSTRTCGVAWKKEIGTCGELRRRTRKRSLAACEERERRKCIHKRCQRGERMDLDCTRNCMARSDIGQFCEGAFESLDSEVPCFDEGHKGFAQFE